MKDRLRQIPNDRQIYALDIGSHSIRLISGIVSTNKKLIISGMLQYPSKGIIQGNIYDVNLLAKQIAFLIQDFQIKFNVIIDRVITGVSGLFIVAGNEHGSYTIQNGVVDSSSRDYAISSATVGFSSGNKDHSIIQVLPQNFQTETFRFIKDPIGLQAKRLDVDVHVIACQNIFKNNLELTIKKINPDLELFSLIYMGNAASSAVLTDSEKETGVIHIDIGGYSTNITVFEGGRLIISAGINYGGCYLTAYISRCLTISMQLAEKLKCKHGIASFSLVPKNMKKAMIRESSNSCLALPYVESTLLELRVLCNIINRALISIFENIFQKIIHEVAKSYRAIEISSGVVLTGGTVNLVGIEKVFSDFISVFNKGNNSLLKCSPNVRIGLPIGIESISNTLLSETVFKPDNAGVIGLLKTVSRDEVSQYTINRNKIRQYKAHEHIISLIGDWFKNEFLN